MYLKFKIFLNMYKKFKIFCILFLFIWIKVLIKCLYTKIIDFRLLYYLTNFSKQIVN